jgi:hypothetical protein
MVPKQKHDRWKRYRQAVREDNFGNDLDFRINASLPQTTLPLVLSHEDVELIIEIMHVKLERMQAQTVEV